MTRHEWELENTSTMQRTYGARYEMRISEVRGSITAALKMFGRQNQAVKAIHAMRHSLE